MNFFMLHFQLFMIIISSAKLWPHPDHLLPPRARQSRRPQLTDPPPAGRVTRQVVDKVRAQRVRVAETLPRARVGHFGDGVHEAGAAGVAVEEVAGG